MGTSSSIACLLALFFTDVIFTERGEKILFL